MEYETEYNKTVRGHWEHDCSEFDDTDMSDLMDSMWDEVKDDLYDEVVEWVDNEYGSARALFEYMEGYGRDTDDLKMEALDDMRAELEEPVPGEDYAIFNHVFTWVSEEEPSEEEKKARELEDTIDVLEGIACELSSIHTRLDMKEEQFDKYGLNKALMSSCKTLIYVAIANIGEHIVKLTAEAHDLRNQSKKDE